MGYVQLVVLSKWDIWNVNYIKQLITLIIASISGFHCSKYTPQRPTLTFSLGKQNNYAIWVKLYNDVFKHNFYLSNRKRIKNQRNLQRKCTNVFPSVVIMMNRCKCSALHQGIRDLRGQVVGRCRYNVAQVTHPTVVAGSRWTLADYVTTKFRIKIPTIRWLDHVFCLTILSVQLISF